MENIILFIPITAYILDAIFSEPDSRFHPVCWLGNIALFLEQKTFFSSKSQSAIPIRNFLHKYYHTFFCCPALTCFLCAQKIFALLFP